MDLDASRCSSLCGSFDKQAIKEMVREAQVEALEEILSRFSQKEYKLKDVSPEVAEMMRGFRGVIEKWEGGKGCEDLEGGNSSES